MFEGLKKRFFRALAPVPRVALGEISFALFPQIVQRGGQYYLRYQIQMPPGDQFQARMVPFSRITNDKGYYFFGTPISLPERGHLVESPLSSDGLTNFAKTNAIYWLNPDGREVHLEILMEAEHRP
jgi:hypothetical protein